MKAATLTAAANASVNSLVVLGMLGILSHQFLLRLFADDVQSILRNAISAFLSSADILSPNSCP
jgi:hypothetical protein